MVGFRIEITIHPDPVVRWWLLGPTYPVISNTTSVTQTSPLCRSSHVLTGNCTVDRRNLPPRRHAAKSVDSRIGVHLRARKPQQTTKLLYRDLLRQMAALLHASHDLRHRISLRSAPASYRPPRRTCVRFSDESVAGAGRGWKVPCYAAICEEVVCAAGGHGAAERGRDGFLGWKVGGGCAECTASAGGEWRWVG